MNNRGALQRIINRVIYHTLLKGCELTNQFRHNIDSRKTICVFANPRGGSTWLANLFLEIPKSVMAWEPLAKGKLKHFNELDFFWHQPIPVTADWPRAKNAFKKLLNREILDLSVYYQNDLLRIPKAQCHIFKFCHGNMLLDWLTNNFEINPILLIRHPCAVISSQLMHHGWRDVKKGNVKYELPEFKFGEVYLQYNEILNRVKSVEENLAATWALTMVTSVQSQSNDKKWITVAYESLFLNFEFEINRIFQRLNMEVPVSIYDKKLVPTSTTVESSKNHIRFGGQLDSWKTNLSLKQRNNILGIVKEFGIDFYNLTSQPDLDKIYSR